MYSKWTFYIHNLKNDFSLSYIYILQVPKGRSLSMRQSSGNRRAYNEFGYQPKNSSAATPTRPGASSAIASPDIVVNGHGNDSSADSMGSASRHRGVPDNSRLGTAANPNRSDVPDLGRRKSHDQTTSLVSTSVYMLHTL